MQGLGPVGPVGRARGRRSPGCSAPRRRWSRRWTAAPCPTPLARGSRRWWACATTAPVVAPGRAGSSGRAARCGSRPGPSAAPGRCARSRGRAAVVQPADALACQLAVGRLARSGLRNTEPTAGSAPRRAGTARGSARCRGTGPRWTRSGRGRSGRRRSRGERPGPPARSALARLRVPHRRSARSQSRGVPGTPTRQAAGHCLVEGQAAVGVGAWSPSARSRARPACAPCPSPASYIDEEAATADAGGVGLGDAEGGGCSDGGVDGVATATQDAQAGPGGLRVDRADRAAAPDGGGLLGRGAVRGGLGGGRRLRRCRRAGRRERPGRSRPRAAVWRRRIMPDISIRNGSIRPVPGEQIGVGGVQPDDPRVPAEPGLLAAGEPPGRAHGLVPGLLLGPLARRGAAAPARSPAPGTRCAPPAARRRPARAPPRPGPAPTSGRPVPRSARRAPAAAGSGRPAPPAPRRPCSGSVAVNGCPVSSTTSRARTSRRPLLGRIARGRRGVDLGQPAVQRSGPVGGELGLQPGAAPAGSVPGNSSRSRAART